MPEDLTVDKDKFDTLLRKLISSLPTSLATIKAIPKIKKDGQPKRGKRR